MDKRTNLLNTQDFSDKVEGIPVIKATNGEKIKALRMAEGMRRSELAEQISVSDRSIRFIENGERNPSEYTLQKIAAIFGITMDYFTDTTISKQELDDARIFGGIYKKYEINSNMQMDEIIEKITTLLDGGGISADKQVEFAKRIEPLLLRMRGDQEK